MSGWNFAQPDWAERLKAGRSLLPDLPLDAEEANRAVTIYNRLRLPDVPGNPTLGEAAGEWSRDIPRAIFGSLDRRSGIRRVPGIFHLVPKKNSKTTSGGAVMLTALLMNQRPNIPFGLFGPTQEISDIAFQTVAGMIEADADLSKLFHVQGYRKAVENRITGATLKVTTFDPAVATGGKYAGWLLDEMHLLGKVGYAARVIGQLRGARVAVPESFGVIITTQSDEPPAGAFKEELDYARAVRDGKIDNPSILPLLYEFPEEMQRDAEQWRDERNWPMVLPNLGRSVSLDVLRQDFATARDKGDAEERRWASQHLNIQIGLALHSDRWIGADFWEQAEQPGLTLDTLIARSDVAVVGVDGGGLDDLMGVAVIGRERETKRWLLWTHAWAHREVLARRKDIESRLQDFAGEGTLTICDHATQDIDDVADLIERLKNAGLLPDQSAVGLDPMGVAAMVDEIAGRGLAEGQIVGVAQGFRLNGAVLGAERKLKDGTLVHGGQALMAWCVGNAKIEQKGNAVLVTKQAAGRAKIDPLMAAFNAVVLMSRNPDATRSFWEAA